MIRYRALTQPTVLEIKIRFANHEVKMQSFDLPDRSGYLVVRVNPQEKGGISGYLVELYQNGNRIDCYSHLWVEPIILEET